MGCFLLQNQFYNFEGNSEKVGGGGDGRWAVVCDLGAVIQIEKVQGFGHVSPTHISVLINRGVCNEIGFDELIEKLSLTGLMNYELIELGCDCVLTRLERAALNLDLDEIYFPLRHTDVKSEIRAAEL